LSVQWPHCVPTAEKSLSRLRTGYERVIAQRMSPPFAYVAQDDGKIIDLNPEIKTLAIQYKTKGMYVLSYGETYSRNGGGGFYITQRMVVNNFTKGDSFKRGDVLLYNRDFFSANRYNKQVDMSLGVYANVTFMDYAPTIEDGSVISSKLSQQLSFLPVREVALTISRNTTIHTVAEIGTKVKSIEPLMVFDESNLGVIDAKNEAAMAAIASLNRATPKAKYSGTVVDIKVFHRCEVSDMSPSLKTLVRAASRLDTARHKYSVNAINADAHREPKAVTVDKLDGRSLGDDDVVIKFYIQQDIDLSSGDKLVIGSSLKSVNSYVSDSKILVEDDSLEIDAVMGTASLFNRMVISPLFIGIMERIMEKIEQDAVKMYFE
jgi:hypothetical protein